MTPGGLFAGDLRWFSIAAHRPFLDDFAWGLVEELAPAGPESLADAVVLTPTRRAGRELQAAFLKHARGGALLLPQIRTLGDLDEGEPPFETAALALDLPAAISPRRRQFELSRIALEHQDQLRRSLDAAAALETGAALGRLLESAAIEEVSLDGLGELTDGEHAEHWALSADFLIAAVESWRRRLATLGVVDTPARQVALLRLLAEQWTRQPPDGVVVAAGSTGTAPAQRALLKVIGSLPRGAVVLPGLDDTLADAAWALIEDREDQHPQSALKRLLESCGVARGDVRTWPAPDSAAEARRGRWRRRVINEALRPVEATADWLDAIAEIQRQAAPGEVAVAQGLAGLTRVTAKHEGEAAAAAALLLRQTLETPGATAAVVTPDPVLARRIQAALARWGVTADSSAGLPLSLSPVGVLTLAVARAAASRRPDGLAILSLLKSPLTRLGRPWLELRRAADTLEARAIRGPAVRDWPALERRLREPLARTAPEDAERRGRLEAALALLAEVRAILEAARQPFVDGLASVAEAAGALGAALERLALGEAGGTGGLWAGVDGEAAAALIAALAEESDELPPVTPSGFADLLEVMLGAEIVRAAEATHSRVRVLGTIEARLVRADRLILAGLEEGTWPAAAPTDPFLSRPMRVKLGLPSPERRVGQSAHDFAQAACASDVVLLNAERREGAPAVKSRWLWRLETLARGAGVRIDERRDVLDWVRALDRPEGRARPAERPAPRPPLAARPRTLSATRIEGWVRDPYAVYARYVLGLSKLRRPSEAVAAAARGTAIHAALEAFVRQHPDALPPDCEGALLDAVTEALENAGLDDAAMVRERLLAAGCARWLSGFEQARRAGGARVLVEQEGRLTLAIDGEDFTVTAKADRLEVDGARVHVWDYKTGHAPSEKEILSGLSPQLTLTAAIVAGGGFDGLPTTPGDLGYVRLTGRDPAPGEDLIRIPAAAAPAAAEAVIADLARLVRAYRDEATPYVSWKLPRLLSRMSGDYDQLARLWEWHVIGAEEEGAA